MTKLTQVALLCFFAVANAQMKKKNVVDGKGGTKDIFVISNGKCVDIHEKCVMLDKFSWTGITCLSTVHQAIDVVQNSGYLPDEYKQHVVTAKEMVDEDIRVQNFCPQHCGMCDKPAKAVLQLQMPMPQKPAIFVQDFAAELAKALGLKLTSIKVGAPAAMGGRRNLKTTAGIEVNVKITSSPDEPAPLNSLLILEQELANTDPSVTSKIKEGKYGKLTKGIVVTSKPKAAEAPMSLKTIAALVIGGFILFWVICCCCCCWCCGCCCFKKDKSFNQLKAKINGEEGEQPYGAMDDSSK